ncbi:conserved hypothetical protein [Streptomyces sviceus ATCC 29083]|uniref:Uncharacterized protein n=2 Tax=Streptomyces TaxID=1883 RepID=B5HY42_STRX2|nr:conserved hypothetical protein [Streptomyces sviceus ATCC 29083]
MITSVVGTGPLRPCAPGPQRFLARRHPVMLLSLTLLIAGIALIATGAAVDGMRYLMSIGVLLLIVDLLYLATRSIWRSTHRPAR